MKSFRLLILSFILLSLLSACGQYGALYLPDNKPVKGAKSK